MEIKDLTIKKFHQGLINKGIFRFWDYESVFDYIEEKDRDINAYLRLTKDLALSQANRVDIELAKGKDLSVLAGVSLAIKDNILIEGELATAGSKILENYRASYDATVIKKLKESGAIFLGKTNMDEFAMGSSTENSAFKITKNPRDLERVPRWFFRRFGGGGGFGYGWAALGSDTGGSVRQPAGFAALSV